MVKARAITLFQPLLGHPLAMRARTRPWAAFVELVCRFGYAARGAVYIGMGVLALLAALDLAPRASGATDAIEAWAAWPLGEAVIFLIATGLAGFAAWRALQSILDADRQGASALAIFRRLGQAISGLVYGALSLSAFELLDLFDDLGESDDRREAQAFIQQALDLPGGALLAMAAGAFVIACGVSGLVTALDSDFCKRLRCGEILARRAALVGRLGYAARGLVFLTAGIFALLAGLHARASEAKGIGAVLDWLETRLFGDLLLAAIAAGLVAFGLFALAEARFRQIDVPAPRA